MARRGYFRAVARTIKHMVVAIAVVFRRFHTLIRIILLVSALAAFSFIGGFMFQLVESPKEQLTIALLSEHRNHTLSDMYDLLTTEKVKAEQKRKFTLKLSLYALQYQAAIRNGTSFVNGEPNPQWTFAGSTYFCVTTFTQLGFGNLAPKSVLGRVVSVLYACFSIPLVAIMFSDLGNQINLMITVAWIFCSRTYRNINEKANENVIMMGEVDVDSMFTSWGVDPFVSAARKRQEPQFTELLTSIGEQNKKLKVRKKESMITESSNESSSESSTKEEDDLQSSSGYYYTVDANSSKRTPSETETGGERDVSGRGSNSSTTDYDNRTERNSNTNNGGCQNTTLRKRRILDSAENVRDNTTYFSESDDKNSSKNEPPMLKPNQEGKLVMPRSRARSKHPIVHYTYGKAMTLEDTKIKTKTNDAHRAAIFFKTIITSPFCPLILKIAFFKHRLFLRLQRFIYRKRKRSISDTVLMRFNKNYNNNVNALTCANNNNPYGGGDWAPTKTSNERLANEDAGEDDDAESVLSEVPLQAIDPQPVILINILLVIGYLVMGTAITCMYEPWHYIDGAWFLIMSVLTVGYGDVTPSDTVFFAMFIPYIVLGMALVTNLIDTAMVLISNVAIAVSNIGKDMYKSINTRSKHHMIRKRMMRARRWWLILRSHVSNGLPRRLVQESRDFKRNLLDRERAWIRESFRIYFFLVFRDKFKEYREAVKESTKRRLEEYMMLAKEKAKNEVEEEQRELRNRLVDKWTETGGHRIESRSLRMRRCMRRNFEAFKAWLAPKPDWF